ARPWLLSIARNVLVSSVRRQVLERSACERLGLEARLDQNAPAAEPDERWLGGLDDALRELPPDHRGPVPLRLGDDLPYDEAADALGTSAAAARVRVHRGLASLRNRFANRPEARK